MSCMCRKCGGESVMVELDHVVEEVLKVINDNGFSQKGAFNLRQNGTSICHGDSEHIKIKKKTDKPGIDIYIDGDTKGEKVYIPVVVSVSGMTDLVYNDFYIADGADVTIVAGCGIHNSGCNESRHDGKRNRRPCAEPGDEYLCGRKFRIYAGYGTDQGR